MKTLVGYSKETFTDDYVLLAGYGTKPITDFLTTSGGQISNKIYRRSGGQWIKGRDNVVIENSYPGGYGSYVPIIGVNSNDGYWSIGALSNANDFYFVFTSNTNYNGTGNESIRYKLSSPSNLDADIIYTILTSNNYTSYVYSKSTSDGRYVYKSGDTITGSLIVPSLTVTGASTFSQAINASILGNAATASRLLNTRTITIGSKSNTFDGSADISFTLALIGAQASGNYKTTQTAVSTIGNSSNTLTFINSISQNTNGVISATTETIPDAATNQSGIVNTTTQSFAGTKTFIDDNWATQVIIKRNTNKDSVIRYDNSTGVLGYIGVGSAKFPYWATDSSHIYTLYHTGNLSPLTTSNYTSYAVSLTETQTVSGNKTFSGSTTLDDATIGNLVVTGGVSFAQTINGNAATASKWAAARTITLSNHASGSVSLDGSGDVTLSVTVTGGSATDSTKLPLTGGTLEANTSSHSPLIIKSHGTSNSAETDWASIKFLRRTGNTLGYIGIRSNMGAYYYDTEYKTLIHSGNIGSQSVSYATTAGSASAVTVNTPSTTDDSLYNIVFHSENNLYTSPAKVGRLTGRITCGNLSCGAITASDIVTLAADKTTDDGITGALNLNNSNIIGVNGIYFYNACDSAGEGINFKRTGTYSSYIDTLYCLNGKLYLRTTRSLGENNGNLKQIAFVSEGSTEIEDRTMYATSFELNYPSTNISSSSWYTYNSSDIAYAKYGSATSYRLNGYYIGNKFTSDKYLYVKDGNYAYRIESTASNSNYAFYTVDKDYIFVLATNQVRFTLIPSLMNLDQKIVIQGNKNYLNIKLQLIFDHDDDATIISYSSQQYTISSALASSTMYYGSMNPTGSGLYTVVTADLVKYLVFNLSSISKVTIVCCDDLSVSNEISVHIYTET